MPLVRISFTPAYEAQIQRSVADEIHAALVESISIPADDRYQLLRQSGEMIYDRSYLGVERTEPFITIEVVMRRGRIGVRDRGVRSRRSATFASHRSRREARVRLRRWGSA